MDLLFVYGSLRSEFHNPFAARLRAEAEFVGHAAIAGSIFRVGTYPAFRPEPQGEVQGEVYAIRSPEALFRLLDDYEGEEYERVKADGYWIYQYRTQPPAAARILSGDYCSA